MHPIDEKWMHPVDEEWSHPIDEEGMHPIDEKCARTLRFPSYYPAKVQLNEYDHTAPLLNAALTPFA